MRLIILGGPGSGKGTQAQRLSQQFAVPWISTGEVLRAEVNAGTDLGKRVEALLARGELAPDEMMIDFIKARLQAVDAANGWVLDGYPRTAFQAEELDFFLDSVRQVVDYAVWLEVPAHVLIERSQNRGAIDDGPDALRRRIETALEVTTPMLDYYGYRNRLLKIDGNQTPDEVRREILEKLSPKS